MHVAGWWDQEDFTALSRCMNYLKRLTRRLNYFVAGPWNHAGWRVPDGTRLGEITFDSNTSKYFREQIEAPWFAWWLHNRGNGHFAEATGIQTGRNRWEQYGAWPPPAARPTSLYLRTGGKLSFEPPASDEGEAFDSYVSDPAHPIPYRHRPISPTYPAGGWLTWLVEDQRFVDNRPDVLTWQTDTLKDTVVVAGNIAAHIFASTTCTDADWVVKLVDVYPANYPENPKRRAMN